MSEKNELKTFKVWISDSESGACQPIRCKARNAAEARKIGKKYIRDWDLEDGAVRKIEEDC